MNRINLTNEYGMPTGTWFDADRATRYNEDTRWDGRNNISCTTGNQWEHEDLFHTASGRWILRHSSQWEGVAATWREIPETEAFKWLVANEHADIVEQLNANALALREVGAGNTPQRTIRIAEDLWRAAQDRARADGTDTSGLIRRLLTEYLV